MSPDVASLTRALDTTLDRSVVLGYTRIGASLRRQWWPADPPAGALQGRVVAVTGANSGLGKATVAGAARLGAEVRMLCRSVDRGEEARAEILETLPDAVLHVDRCDVSDLRALPEVARSLREQVPRLHALVHNAGVLPPERTETADGHELTFATHVLGPHVLTHELRGSLAADGDARVVFMSSGGMYTSALDVADPEHTRGRWSGTRAYARTKRMQVHLAEEWARRLSAEGVAVHSMHPGWAGTPGVASSLPAFNRLTGPLLRDPAVGADTAVWLLAAPEGHEQTGLFWHDRAPRPTSYLARTAPGAGDVARLWELVVAATGVPPDERGSGRLSG
jgi:NAD(P)-dependent dehydrogenase (short-subunit alcohol dehydrogenase family)